MSVVGGSIWEICAHRQVVCHGLLARAMAICLLKKHLERGNRVQTFSYIK